jgi:hypothetical protein
MMSGSLLKASSKRFFHTKIYAVSIFSESDIAPRANIAGSEDGFADRYADQCRRVYSPCRY